MIEAYGNIWDYIEEYDAVVITTNGFVKKNGEAVMGRGIALEAKNRYPYLAGDLGSILKAVGNHLAVFWYNPNHALITFPVKPEFGLHGEPGWRAKADIDLIKQSAEELVRAVDWYINPIVLRSVLLPRPGCGNGGLKWEQVKPVIEPILDDRFTVMERL